MNKLTQGVGQCVAGQERKGPGAGPFVTQSCLIGSVPVRVRTFVAHVCRAGPCASAPPATAFLVAR